MSRKKRTMPSSKGRHWIGEPEVERVRVEGLELAGNALIHGAMEVMEDFLVLGGDGKLLPEVFAEEFALWG